MATKKLQDAFNACADKIVDELEFQQMELAIDDKLTREEWDLVVSSAGKHWSEASKAIAPAYLQGDTVERRKLLSAVGDGTAGAYVSEDGRAFDSVKSIKFYDDIVRDKMQKDLSPALRAKLDDAYADVLLNATDYKNKVKLKPAL